MEPVIVVLHGWESKIERWRPFQKEIEKAGFKVSLSEMPGFGKSKPPKKPWSVSDYAQWVKERLPKNYFLLGHSFGGRIAIKLASQKPEGMMGLILVNSAGIKPRNALKRTFFLILAKTGKLFFSRDSARKILYKLARERDYYRAQGVMKETLKKVISEDLKGDLKKINVPTLILWGEKDQLTPVSDGRLMDSLISYSNLLVFSDAGHDLPLKFPRKVAKAVVAFCSNN